MPYTASNFSKPLRSCTADSLSKYKTTRIFLQNQQQLHRVTLQPPTYPIQILVHYPKNLLITSSWSHSPTSPPPSSSSSAPLVSPLLRPMKSSSAPVAKPTAPAMPATATATMIPAADPRASAAADDGQAATARAFAPQNRALAMPVDVTEMSTRTRGLDSARQESIGGVCALRCADSG
jgi:hypothetical protein